MWLASPSAKENVQVYRIYANGEFSSGLYWRSYDENFGFRPVICLNAEVMLTQNQNDHMSIK